ncbi:Imidazolonepropionase [Algoriphagus faecimaris]|uniref:Imidazolonepropionase n=1 Tax=Algoriphagus faecimaris TaxID=686796 RepID=A0A1G6NA15_9BACT|nr:amidohydrolase family protein [Algoriphagus faecimaris]SDC64659.1 Imidazolonepropionase [Algoriphagus faecimaris]
MKLFILGILLPFLNGTAPYQDTDTLLINHVNVISMTSNEVLEDQEVWIVNQKIQRIQAASNSLKSGFYRVVDASGKYLVPGFHEMHFHWRNQQGGIERDLNLLLANGVTTVRNMAEYDWQDQVAIREKINSGEILGPRYFTTGPYLNSSMLQSEEEAREKVQLHIEKGYDFLKIADNLPENSYLILLEEAEKVGLPVIGHAQRALEIDYSLRMKSIEHVEEFVYLFEETQRNDENFMDSIVEEIKISGITIVPTLKVFERIVYYLNDSEFKKLEQVECSEYMLPGDRNYWLSDENPYRKDLKGKVLFGKDAEVLLAEWLVWMKDFTLKLAEAGVPFMIGSDTFGLVVPGFSLHEEMELLQDAGMDAFEILKAATITPARYLGTQAVEGTVSVGKNANLVLLHSNPLEDIRATKDISAVILNGKLMDRNSLDSLLKEVLEINASFIPSPNSNKD